MTEEEKLYKEYMDLIGPSPSDWVKKLISDLIVLPITPSNLDQFKNEYIKCRNIVGPNPSAWVNQLISDLIVFPITPSNLIQFKEEYSNQINWERQLKLIKELVSKKERESLPDLPLSTEQTLQLTEKYKRRLPSLLKRQKLIDALLLTALWKPIVNVFSKTVKDIDEHQFVYIPSGEFMMGALPGDDEAYDWEKPRHVVQISRPFWVGKYQVTQEQYKAVTGKNPSHFKGENHPVEQVNWFDAIQFCNTLSKKERLQPVYKIDEEEVNCDWSANGYRLPTEAEWEYAAKAGSDFLYAGLNSVAEVAWYHQNSGHTTHPVGQKKVNAYGLYDMSGNVWEWVWDWDWYGNYSSGTVTDPKGPDLGSYRVYRGGSWVNDARGLRVSYRNGYGPSGRYSNLGLRLSRSAQ